MLWCECVNNINTHHFSSALQAIRYGVLGVSDVNVYASLGAILMFVVAFYLLALWLLQRGTGIRH